MESLEKLFFPTTQVTKRTAGLTLHKLSVDRCSYVLVTWNMKFNVIKQTVWNRSRQTGACKHLSLKEFHFLEKECVKNQINLC